MVDCVGSSNTGADTAGSLIWRRRVLGEGQYMMNQATMVCEICNSTGGKIHHVREMMFGWGDEFEYLECPACGCLSLVDVPADLSKYYPESYYSMVPGNSSVLRKLRDYIYLSSLSFLVNWRPRLD